MRLQDRKGACGRESLALLPETSERCVLRRRASYRYPDDNSRDECCAAKMTNLSAQRRFSAPPTNGTSRLKTIRKKNGPPTQRLAAPHHLGCSIGGRSPRDERKSALDPQRAFVAKGGGRPQCGSGAVIQRVSLRQNGEYAVRTVRNRDAVRLFCDRAERKTAGPSLAAYIRKESRTLRHRSIAPEDASMDHMRPGAFALMWLSSSQSPLHVTVECDPKSFPELPVNRPGFLADILA